MLPAAHTTTRGSHTVSAGALEVKWSFKALKKCSSLTFDTNLYSETMGFLYSVEGMDG